MRTSAREGRVVRRIFQLGVDHLIINNAHVCT